jgi:hypothetical protein
MAIGVSSSSEAMGNIALISEITSGGGGIRSTTLNTYESSGVSVWYGRWDFTTSFNVNEAGIFDTSSGTGGRMFIRHAFTATKAVASGDSLGVTIKLTQST